MMALLTAATFWPLATALFAIFSYYFFPGAYKDTGIESAWQKVERRARTAATTAIQHDLPRGWVKRSILGRLFYYDLLTDQWSRQRPGPRPMYTKVVTTDLPDLRLITIVPAAYDAPLECLLFTVPFATWTGVTDIPFRWLRRRSTRDLVKLFSEGTFQIFHKRIAVGDILTWCWGNPKITESITVNDRAFDVTTNLAAALRQFRAAANPITLWIDAICINQQDGAEIQEMLALMRMLYMSAKTVHCWLGETEEVHQDRFFEIVDRIRRNDLAPLGPDTVLALQEGTYPLEDMWSDRQCLEAIAALPYWSRKWIIQEVVLSTRLKVYCGNRSVLMQDPTLLASALQRLYYHVAIASVNTWAHPQYGTLFDTPVRNMRVAFIGLRAGAKLKSMKDYRGLPGVLQDLRLSSATNPKDAVFGILALLEPFDIKPDISASVSDVFLLATTRIMTVTQSLGLLEQARFAGSPSWIPEFSQPFPSDKFQSHGPEGVTAKPCFTIYGAALQTSAFELGVIAAVCKAELDPAQQSEHFLPIITPQWTRKRFAGWKAFFDAHGGDSEHELMWRVLCQDIESRRTDDGLRVNSDVTAAKLGETQEAVEKFLAGDDTAYNGEWARYVDTQTIFVTTDGTFGMTFSDADVAAGDRVFALASAPVPFCVRPVVRNHCCTRCKMDIQEAFYRCGVCHDGNFVLCPSCREEGCLEGHVTGEYLLSKDGAQRRSSWVEGGYDVCAQHGTLQASCYLQDTWSERPMRKAATERFGDESRIDDVFETLVLW